MYDYGIADTIEDVLKWLLININRYLELRKNDLHHKCPGALAMYAEPRLIWISMLKRPVDSFDKQVHSLAQKFNGILEKVVSGDKRSHILKVHVDTHAGNYDCIGNLMSSGMMEMWRCIDHEMKDFDNGDTDLEPFHQKLHPPRRPTGLSKSQSYPKGDGHFKHDNYGHQHHHFPHKPNNSKYHWYNHNQNTLRC